MKIKFFNFKVTPYIGEFEERHLSILLDTDAGRRIEMNMAWDESDDLSLIDYLVERALQEFREEVERRRKEDGA